MSIFVWLVLCVSIGLAMLPSPLLARQVNTETKKNVIKNFKINLSQFSAFGTDCSKKPRGDANCDGRINQFDLSIWEVEFNSTNPPKRADFNGDGAVTIVDYGIWRTTAFPQQTALNKLFETLVSHISYLVSPAKALAEESGGGEINSSQSFTSSGGTGLVVNNLSGGNTQQVNFDASGNPQTAAFYDQAGKSYAEVAFTSSGGTIISTEQSGIPVTINKTASGPIIENFRNPDGTPLAIKSWPTQASYDAGQPPVAVTIPGIGSTKEVLNLQPNGDAIVEKLDAAGNVLTRTQLRSNGTTVTEDFQNSTLVQSNSEVGFTSMSMKNLIGGQTQYMFYKGTLYAIVQTDDKKNSFISKPLDNQGNSWTYEALVDGVKKSEETVPDPITKTNGGTPNPKTLIQYINYYKQAPTDPNAITFSEGFTSTAPGIKTPVDKANAILTISQTQAPAVLGLSLIKEANAQQNSTVVGTLPDGTTISTTNTPNQYTLSSPISFTGTNADGTPVSISGGITGYNINSSTWSPPSGPLAGQPVTAVTIDFFDSNYTVIGSLSIYSDQNPKPGTVDVNSLAITQVGATPVAPQTDPVAPPAAPLPPTQPAGPTQPGGPGMQQYDPRGASISQACEGACGIARSNYGDYNDFTKNGGTLSVQDWAASKGITDPSQINDIQSIKNSHDAFSATITTQAPGQAGQYDDLVKGGGAAGLEDAARKAGVSESVITQAQQAALAAAGGNTNIMTAGGGLVGVQQAHTDNKTQGNQSSAPPSGAAAAAAATPGIPTPQSGFIGTTGVYSQVTLNLGNGSFVSEIKSGGPGGQTIATQTHNPTSGSSFWTDDRGTTFTQGGAVTGYTPNINPFTPGQATTYALDTSGNIVAVGYGTAVDANGRVRSGRSVAGEELSFARGQMARQDAETRNTTGVSTGIDFSTAKSTCFLPGTLISTPNGPTAIETLKPGDKVFSYNEKTGAKQISDFQKLSINFVDEYLIINNQIKTTIYHPFYIVETSSLRGAERRGNLDNNQDRDANARDDTLITVRADALKIGDIMLNESSKQIPVHSIEKISAPKTTVYNLMNVAPNNNFFAENILVHNYSFDRTRDGSEDPNPGGDPYNPDGSYTDAWADTGGWNPSYYSPDQISSGDLGGTTGGSDVSSDIGRGSSGDGWGSSGGGQAETQQDTTQSTQQDTQQDSGSQQSDGNSSGADSSGW